MGFFFSTLSYISMEKTTDRQCWLSLLVTGAFPSPVAFLWSCPKVDCRHSSSSGSSLDPSPFMPPTALELVWDPRGDNSHFLRTRSPHSPHSLWPRQTTFQFWEKAVYHSFSMVSLSRTLSLALFSDSDPTSVKARVKFTAQWILSLRPPVRSSRITDCAGQCLHPVYTGYSHYLDQGWVLEQTVERDEKALLQRVTLCAFKTVAWVGEQKGRGAQSENQETISQELRLSCLP